MEGSNNDEELVVENETEIDTPLNESRSATPVAPEGTAIDDVVASVPISRETSLEVEEPLRSSLFNYMNYVVTPEEELSRRQRILNAMENEDYLLIEASRQKISTTELKYQLKKQMAGKE